MIAVVVITSTQSKMARAALGWSLRDLAAAAGVGVNTANNLEHGSDARISTARKIQEAYEAEGIEFIEDGVRYRPNE